MKERKKKILLVPVYYVSKLFKEWAEYNFLKVWGREGDGISKNERHKDSIIDEKQLIQLSSKGSYSISDEFILIHRDKNGKILHYLDSRDWEHDTLTNIGMQLAAKRLGNVDSVAQFNYIGIGTGTTPANAAQTNLETQQSRLSCTPTVVTTTVTNDTLQLDIVFSYANDNGLTGTDAITETGVFNASGTTDNAMLWRQIFTAINCNWDDGDTLEMICKTQIKQGS